jgi:hypothetical protein
MDVGKPKRVRKVEPLRDPVPQPQPVEPERTPAPEQVPAHV